MPFWHRPFLVESARPKRKLKINYNLCFTLLKKKVSNPLPGRSCRGKCGEPLKPFSHGVRGKSFVRRSDSVHLLSLARGFAQNILVQWRPTSTPMYGRGLNFSRPAFQAPFQVAKVRKDPGLLGVPNPRTLWRIWCTSSSTWSWLGRSCRTVGI